MQGANGDGAVVLAAVIPDRQTPFTVLLSAGIGPIGIGGVGGHYLSVRRERNGFLSLKMQQQAGQSMHEAHFQNRTDEQVVEPATIRVGSS